MTKTYVITDIHGCFKQLELALWNIAQDSQSGGTVVFLGDYVDRGPESLKVLELLRDGPQMSGWEWITLLGNHEHMMCTEDMYQNWVLNGGGWGDVDDWMIDMCREMKLWHEDKHRVYVHAGVKEGIALDDQDPVGLIWGRYPVGYDEPFFDKHVVHGHTPHREPLLLKHRTNLDTACFKTGILSVGVFDDDTPGGPIKIIQCSSAPEPERDTGPV